MIKTKSNLEVSFFDDSNQNSEYKNTYSKYESNNTVRFITGIIAGIGTMSLVGIVGGIIANFLLTIIN